MGGPAYRAAVRQMQAAVARSHASQQEIVGCALLIPAPMPDWSIEDILAVHIRMHEAEGVLFPDALAAAAGACGLPLVLIREKVLWETAEQAFAPPRQHLSDQLAAPGRTAGPPWGKDQKSAALGAMIVLRTA